ncbi:hypothetical protein NL676_033971 [Syzygium grande]|nr:hypothetical protein NL676_033971 [Syzygium grande]
MPAFVHFEDDDIVETHWPATGRKGKGKASNKVEEEIDTRADEFINRFRQHLKLHRPDSIIRFEEMLNRGCSSASPPHFEEDDIVEARLLATERKAKGKASDELGDEVEEQELHARADDFIKRLSRQLRAGAMCLIRQSGFASPYQYRHHLPQPHPQGSSQESLSTINSNQWITQRKKGDNEHIIRGTHYHHSSAKKHATDVG